MILSEFKKSLAENSYRNIRFVLPTGSKIPAHAHVTEVARMDKRFIDCGGTFRSETICRLQTWFADDTDHRLTAGKLLAILDKSAPFLETENLEIDVEHEAPFVSQFPVTSVEASGDALILLLGVKHTACLAEDKCLPAALNKSPILTTLPDFKKASAVNLNNFMTTKKPVVLILCTGNSCRSHLAEGFLRAAAGDILDVQSAGSKPAGYVHPMAIKVMQEVGIDISQHRSKHLSEFLDRKVETVVTVCGNADEACPIFPGQLNRHHWAFYDPAKAKGSEQEVLKVFREIRDQIKRVFEAYGAGREDNVKTMLPN